MSHALAFIGGPIGGALMLAAGILLTRRRRRAGFWSTVRDEYTRAIAERERRATAGGERR